MRLSSVLALLSAGCAAVLAVPVTAAEVPKRIYIAPDDHTDYLWSASAEAYADYFPRALDAYLDQIDATEALPADQHARWNTDGSLWMWEYERQRTPAQMQRLMERVRDGHVSMPLNTLVEVRGSMPLEAQLRDMYYAGRLERRFGLRFTLGIAMENQTQPLGLGSVFASAGARYSWKGVCACATQVTASGQRLNPAYWWRGPDGSRLLTKWMSLEHRLPSAVDGNGNQGPGGYAEARYPREVVPFVTSDATFRSHWPFDVIGLIGQGWDDPELIVPLSDRVNSFPAVAQDLSDAGRRVIVSNTEDFFRDFERTYGASLPSEQVSYGNEWELALASIAEKSARVRRAVEKLRSAEALATIVALQDPAFMTGREAARDAAWRAMGLFFEHDIVGGGVLGDGPRVIFQEAQAAAIESYVDTLLSDATARMSQLVPAGAPGKRFFVFNPLGFTRTAPVEVPYPGTGPFSVVATGTTIPLAAEAIGSGAARRLRFLAASVPSVGYKLFDVRDVPPAVALPNTARFEGGVLITSRYRIVMDGRGAIQSLIEPGRGNREWVRPDGGRALNDLGEGTGSVVLESNGPVSATLRADIDGPQPRTVRLTVYGGSGQIDLENRISGGFEDAKTYSFAFAIDRPMVRHEEVGAVIPARLAASGGLSTRTQNTLYEWLTLGHFADITTGRGNEGITLSNSDAYFMRLGTSDAHRLDITTPRIDVLVGARFNGIGLPSQGGDTQFLHRFSLLPHAVYNQSLAMRFALEAQNPLVAGAATGPTSGAPLLSRAWSLLEPTSSHALVWAVKPAEEGIADGVIVRLWNQSAQPATAALRLQQRYAGATIQRTTSIETDVAADDPVAMPDPAALRGNQIGTFRIRLPQ